MCIDIKLVISYIQEIPPLWAQYNKMHIAFSANAGRFRSPRRRIALPGPALVCKKPIGVFCTSRYSPSSAQIFALRSYFQIPLASIPPLM